ncbi:MAG: hypothetical protein ACFE7S_05655 [Candidatus Hodarchaeota archaeon]
MIPRIEVELTVTHQKAKEGNVKILIAGLEKGSVSQQTSKIRFSVENLFHKRTTYKLHKLPEWITEKQPEGFLGLALKEVSKDAENPFTNKIKGVVMFLQAHPLP